MIRDNIIEDIMRRNSSLLLKQGRISDCDLFMYNYICYKTYEFIGKFRRDIYIKGWVDHPVMFNKDIFKDILYNQYLKEFFPEGIENGELESNINTVIDAINFSSKFFNTGSKIKEDEGNYIFIYSSEVDIYGKEPLMINTIDSFPLISNPDREIRDKKNAINIALKLINIEIKLKKPIYFSSRKRHDKYYGYHDMTTSELLNIVQEKTLLRTISISDLRAGVRLFNATADITGEEIEVKKDNVRFIFYEKDQD